MPFRCPSDALEQPVRKGLDATFSQSWDFILFVFNRFAALAGLEISKFGVQRYVIIDES
jgi:hypothetical protein